MRIKNNDTKWYVNFLGVGVFLVLWEASFRFKWVDPFFISAPSKVLEEGFKMFATGKIYPHLLASSEEFALGFFISVFLGVTLGLIIGWYKKVYALFSPLIYAIYSVPHIALFPLIMIWVGLDIWSKVLIISLGAFFPVLITTIQAVKNLDADYIRLARSFGASDFDLFRTVTLPAAVPYIMTGLRMAIPKALLGMIAGEFFASNKGLGFLIINYGATFQTPKLLAVILMVVVVSVLLTESIAYIEKKMQVWKPEKMGS